MKSLRFKSLLYSVCFASMVTGCGSVKDDIAAFEPGPSWRPWKSSYLPTDFPTITVEYKDGELSTIGERPSTAKILEDLRGLSSVPGHPVVVLSLSRHDLPGARIIAHQIEDTRICDDAGCFFDVK